MFLKGEGVDKNTSNALILYQQAAQQNHANAQYHLGLMYHLGDGVPKDDEQAFKWLNKAAEQGLKIAQAALVDFDTNGSEKIKIYIRLVTNC